MGVGGVSGGEPHGPVVVVGLLGILLGMTVLTLGLVLWVTSILHLSRKDLAEHLGRWSGRASLAGFLVALAGLWAWQGSCV